MRMVVWHLDRYNSLSEDDIERLTKSEETALLHMASKDDVIVYDPVVQRTARTPTSAASGSHPRP